MQRLPIVALLLISIILVASCNRAPRMEEEHVAKDEFILAYHNQFQYVIEEEQLTSPFDSYHSFHGVSPFLRKEWASLDIQSARATGKQFYFSYDEKHNQLIPIDKERFHALSKEKMNELYRLSLYLIIEDNSGQTYPTEARLVGSFEWSRPLPDTLNHLPYAFLGAYGRLAYLENYASFQGNIEPTPFFEGKGFGWQGDSSGPVPLYGTFSMIAYQTREATISKEQFVYVVPFHRDNHSAYQVAHEDESLTKSHYREVFPSKWLSFV
ncbi:hypothetical protein FLT15_23565 [Paenibacillus thiaminolyticus]|uniref:hypothetical protein n=2 Tax=Paenibacillus thiaminolyticus TaxID=49283 RepID=UPI001163757B|nr:hypothetical protein [Paenibacillus thiaminolyticus]NGP61213.1 hypothetical protein [Paenibacillus thiaminolyticus]